MSEYWKSIPKKYCNFCKVWFQDNKSSVNFHERGLKHQANVQKHLAQVQKRGVQQAKELNDHEQEMRKIERAAMVSYQQDLIASGKSLPASSSSSIVNRLKSEEEIKEEKEEEEKKLIQGGGRFGDELRTEKSKKQALDMITKKMAKKHEWFESKTVEGKTYYYNRVTYETKWHPPKSGFISLEDQKSTNSTDVPGDQSAMFKAESETKESKPKFKHEQFGRWETVANQDDLNCSIDLQLPNKPLQSIKRAAPKEQEEQIEFKEKTVVSSEKSKVELGFKKRKTVDQSKRNIRQRTDDE